MATCRCNQFGRPLSFVCSAYGMKRTQMRKRNGMNKKMNEEEAAASTTDGMLTVLSHIHA